MLPLNIVPYAADRVYGNTSDTDENVEVSHLEPVAGDAPGTQRVRVQMFGYSQDFVGVTKVYAEGGGGTASALPPNPRVVNDTILIDSDVTSPAEIYGDFNPVVHPGMAAFGDDNITTGAGTVTVYGGGGQDKIVIGTGAALVLAGDGDDTVQGGTGNDSINGELGNDIIYG